MTESESVVLPLDDHPVKLTLDFIHEALFLVKNNIGHCKLQREISGFLQYVTSPFLYNMLNTVIVWYKKQVICNFSGHKNNMEGKNGCGCII